MLTVSATRLQLGVTLAANGFNAQKGVLVYTLSRRLTPLPTWPTVMRLGFLTTIRILRPYVIRASLLSACSLLNRVLLPVLRK